jgi:tellurite resistance protein TehA-like permease
MTFNIDYFMIILAVVILVTLGALYILNIVRLIKTVQRGEYSMVIILRLIGVFWAPIGIIMGFVK